MRLQLHRASPASGRCSFRGQASEGLRVDGQPTSIPGEASYPEVGFDSGRGTLLPRRRRIEPHQSCIEERSPGTRDAGRFDGLEQLDGRRPAGVPQRQLNRRFQIETKDRGSRRLITGSPGRSPRTRSRSRRSRRLLRVVRRVLFGGPRRRILLRRVTSILGRVASRRSPDARGIAVPIGGWSLVPSRRRVVSGQAARPKH